jgi:hypothetical protein
MLVPSFLTSNQDSEGPKGRQLFPKNQINVARDIIDFRFATKRSKNDTLHRFNVQLKDWSEEKIELQLNFNFPSEISISSKDRLVCKIIDPRAFVSKDSGLMLEEDELTFVREIPKQIPSLVDLESL